MNKFYLLALPLLLFNPSFAAVNPQLLKEFEENLSLLMQLKNRKSTEKQLAETTPEQLEEEKSLDNAPSVKTTTQRKEESISRKKPLNDKQPVRKKRNFAKRSTTTATKKNQEKTPSIQPPKKIEEPSNLSQSKGFQSLIQSEKIPSQQPKEPQSLAETSKEPAFPIEEISQ